MLNNVTIGQYLPKDSLIHELDPRTKLLGSLIFIASIFAAKSFTSYGLLFVFLLSVIFLSKIELKFILKGLKNILILILITSVMNLFFTTGEEVIIKFWKITIYKEGLIMAAKMLLRIMFIIIGTSLLTLTTSPIELTDGLEILFKPISKIGFTGHEVAMMITIALRFIPTLMEETDKIIKAQKARGADFETGSLLKRARALVPILVPLFISSFERANELAMAMEARCYRGGDTRTRMKVLKYETIDSFSYGILILLLVIMISLRIISI